VIEGSEPGPPDSPAWVFAGGRTLERATARPAVARLARSLAGTDGRTVQDDASDTRLYSSAIQEGPIVAGTVVSGISLEPYERTASRALTGSVLLAAFLLVLIVLGVRFVVGRALRPVAQMTAEAVRWSESDVDHRFNVGPPHDELTALAATFDGMLDRVAESLRHEQRFTAEVSHELRTPLSAIAAEADLALRRERGSEEYRSALQAIATRARQLQRVLATLLATARAQAAGHGHRCDPAVVAERVLEAHRTADFDGEGPRLELIDHAGGAAIGAEEEVVERILAPLVENACAHARSLVRLTIERAGDELRIAVDDDGPGVPADEHERIFDPGYRASAASENGAGLGLALSRRLARAIGGEVQHPPDANGGANFRVSLPAL
jgi:signal transduction histidine kinase